ncbi:MAG: hypothetical protein RLZ56_563 [Bacteroidota bacterium]|jgi:hypothetical protein
MRVFLVLSSSLPIPKALLLAHAQALIPSLVNSREVQLIVVSNDFDAAMQAFCEAHNDVRMQSIQQAAGFIQQATNAVIVHFGTELNWAKGFPQYFIPLSTPLQWKDDSFLKRYLLKRKMQKWLSDAAKIIALEDWALFNLQSQYPQWLAKIQLYASPLLNLPPVEWQMLAATREQMSAGNSYFLVFAPIERFVPILKAFSVFKKWQQTTMHLVFVFDHPKAIPLANAQLKGYKFKDSISIHHCNEFQNTWLAAAYAVLWQGVNFAHAIWMQTAIQFEIPLWLDTQLALPTHWEKAGEVFSFTEPMELSNHFKLYYKDELYRQAMAKAGKEWLAGQVLSDSPADLFK